MNNPWNLVKVWSALKVIDMSTPWKNLISRMQSSCILGMIFSFAVALSFWIAFQKVAIALIVIIATIAVAEWLAIIKNKDHPMVGAIGWLYIGLGLSCWYTIALCDGWKHAVFLLCAAAFSDTIAYFAGSLLGGPRIFPKISPGKTWSGSVSSLIFSTILTAILGRALWRQSLSLLMLPCLIISLSAQAGDVLESATKRFYDIKDSGHLLPGHGGILDRIDSWLGVAIMFHLIRPFFNMPPF